MATLKTVTGKVTGPDGSPVPRAVITVANSQPTTIPGSQEIAQPTTPVIAGPDGSFSLSLYSNNDLTPNGTAYTVQAVGSIGQMPVTMIWTIQVPQTAGPFEISNITTTTPTAQPTPTHVSTLTVDGAATFTAGPVVIGADPGGAQILRVGGAIALGVSALSAGSASIFSPAANQLSLAVNGAERLRVDATNLIVRSYGYNIGTDSGVFQGVGAVDGVLRAGTTDIVRLQTSGGTNLLSASLASGVTIPSGGLAVSTGDINVASGAGRLLQQGVPWISNGTPNRVVLGNVQWWGIDLLAGNLSTTSENIGVNVPAQTLTVTAAIATQRFALLPQHTITAATAQTVTNAATLAIAGPPIAAGGAIITNPYAFWVQAGNSGFQGHVLFPTDATYDIGAVNPSVARPRNLYLSNGIQFQNGTVTLVQSGPSLVLTSGATPGQGAFLVQVGTSAVLTVGNPGNNPGVSFGAPAVSTASEVQYVLYSAGTLTATGAIVTQRFNFLAQPTITASTAQTVTNAATFAIAGAPIAAGGATITNPFALWVQGGRVQIEGSSWTSVVANSGVTQDLIIRPGTAAGIIYIGDAGRGAQVQIGVTGLTTIANGLTVSAGGARITGDPGGLAGAMGVTNVTGLGNGAQTAVTAPLVGTGSGPATPTAVAQWLKVYDGATTRWIPMMV